MDREHRTRTGRIALCRFVWQCVEVLGPGQDFWAGSTRSFGLVRASPRAGCMLKSRCTRALGRETNSFCYYISISITSSLILITYIKLTLQTPIQLLIEKTQIPFEIAEIPQSTDALIFSLTQRHSLFLSHTHTGTYKFVFVKVVF